jgi:glutamyl-tRNA synthetase
VTPLIQERIVTLDDAPIMGGFFFRETIQPATEDLVGKKMTPAESAAALRTAYDILVTLPMINQETAEEPLRTLAETLGISAGQLFGILRASVTGQTVSPPLFESMAVIGKEKVLERIQHAISILKKM